VTQEREPRDSAGLPWRGRELASTGFDGDDGGGDPALDAALETGGDDALMAAVAGARLLVPVVAEPVVVDPEGHHPVEKETSMAVVTLMAPDGQRALPVFTSVATLSAWNPAARPVPVSAQRAAQAAVSEGCDVMVVNLAGPRTQALRPSMVWALAQHREWLAPQDDPVVAEGVRKAVLSEDSVTSYGLSAGSQPGVLAVSLTLVPGLTKQEVEGLATRVGERLATDGELRARIDGLAFTIR
jgi:SseB protein N-terminal domain